MVFYPIDNKRQGQPYLLKLTNGSIKKIEERNWDDPEARRQFLLEFANKVGFDPMILDNWRDRMPQIRAHGVSIYLFKLIFCLLPTHVYIKGAQLARFGPLPQVAKAAFPTMKFQRKIYRPPISPFIKYYPNYIHV